MFVPLHCYSHYSFLRGTASPAVLARTASRLGYPALALTDRDGVYGAVEFDRACRETGIRPLLGVELTSPAGNLVLLARNREGWSELCRLTTARRLDPGFSPARVFETGRRGNLFILVDNPALLPPSARAIPGLRLAWNPVRARQRGKGEPVAVAMPRVAFPDPAAAAVAGFLSLIRTRKEKTPTRRPDGGCLPRRGELERAGFARAALAESGRLAAACDFRFDGSPPRLYPEGDVGVLRAACRDAFSRTMGGSEPGRVRLERELGVIERMGFAGYFLLAREIVVFAAERAIPWVGRGSAANSLVCYLLGITAVNPLEHGLYFERFLNEHRPDPPDIDIDFPTHRRREVIEFIRRRYGRERTALISTTSRFRGRGAFREAARVLGWREEKIREISRKLPYFFSNREPERLRREIPECRDLPWADSGFCRILTLAAALEGIPRNISVHPGGVVVSPRPLTDMVALERASGGLVVTQPDMYSIRDLGLVKVDILGQRALAVVEDTIRLEAARGTTLDWGTVKPREDEATGRLIATGRTLGCFYIESPVMRLLLRRLGCRDFETLVAASSIIRPGVNSSGLADRYIARSRGEEPVPRLHPLLAPILAETKGVMIYQEQVMRVVSAAAGMSMGDADLFRRAMNGKENMGVLEKRFRSGCRTTGFPEREIDALWGQIRSFAAYSFCKAHSAAFSVLSFQTAWLKAHYPASFLAAVISRRGGFYPSSEYIEEARRLGLEVLSPDVNHSEGVSISEGAGIRLGLMEVSGLGPEAIRRIVVARPRGGFSSWEDFIGRVRPGVAETRRLLSAGALDGLGVGRAELGWKYAAYSGTAGSRRYSPEDRPPVFPGGPPGFPSPGSPVARAPDRIPLPGGDVRLVARVAARRRVSSAGDRMMLFVTLDSERELVEGVMFPDVYARCGHLVVPGARRVFRGRFETRAGAALLVVSGVYPSREEQKGVSRPSPEYFLLPPKRRLSDNRQGCFYREDRGE